VKVAFGNGSTLMQSSARFGELLRHHRLKANLGQEALARRAGLSREAISALERGTRRSPRPETARLLAEALSLDDAARADFSAAAHPQGAVQASDQHMTGLPALLTPLIGREHEVATIVAGLASDELRLLTLTGPAGVGKTSVALAAAHALRDSFADGVCFVSLAPLGESDRVAPEIARALGLREENGPFNARVLREYLCDRRTLLVLDNFERLLVAAPLLTDLLVDCPGLAMLVTSRAPLRLSGERELPILPLALPNSTELVSEQGVLCFGAVALFVARARAVSPDFALTSDNAELVAEICRRLDGLPLAIELAAPRIKLLPPQALLEQLECRLALLTNGARDLPGRHQSLRAALDWSHDLLGTAERALFRRLAVFAGGGSLEAARVVGFGGAAVLDALSALSDHGLVRPQLWAGGAGFGLLETMNEYGLELLAESGEEEATRLAHIEFYLALADEAREGLRGAEGAIWLGRLTAELDNFLAALQWARDSGEIALGLRLAGTLAPFWTIRGHLGTGRRWLEALLTAGDGEGVAVPAALRALALQVGGNLARMQGDYLAADRLLIAALALRRTLDDSEGVAWALNSLGLVAGEQGQYARARGLHEESLVLFREIGGNAQAYALNYLGTMEQAMGDLGRAATLYEEGLTLALSRQDRLCVALGLHNLGEIAQARGQVLDALALLEQSLTMRQELGDRAGIASSLTSLARLARSRGDDERASNLLDEAIPLWREVGNIPGLAHTLEQAAELSLARGDGQHAI
jgi:predicted ATPase/transcriptional regulator with XRE-family HTH domain